MYVFSQLRQSADLGSLFFCFIAVGGVWGGVGGSTGRFVSKKMGKK